MLRESPFNLMIDQQSTLIPVSKIRLGVTLHSPVYNGNDSNALLLLAAGTTITRSLVDRLVKRGVNMLRLSPNEAFRIANLGNESRQQPRLRSRSVPKRPSERPSTRSAVHHDSFLHDLKRPVSDHFDDAQVSVVQQSRERCGQLIDGIYDEMALGDAGRALETSETAAESLLRISQDLDIFLAYGISSRKEKYPSRHGLQTAMLAMAIGTIHGLKRDHLIELGIGCLLHDAGMLLIQEQTYNNNRYIGGAEMLEIKKHPIVGLNLLKSARKLPSTSAMVAYQMHERCNGSGYPRGRTGSQIHLFAKIAGVADAYVAMVTPRSHRPALLPYHAIEQILHGVRQQEYDTAVVRSFLHTVSMFPVGSYVELEDGRAARVLRSRRENYARPMVEVWSLDTLFDHNEVIDLSRDTHPTIIRPIEEPLITDTSMLIA